MKVNPLLADDPSELHGYSLRGRIGQGGMGVVYLARDPAGHEVAVKTILPSREVHEEFRKRFARETRILQTLRDPRIVSVLAAFPGPEKPCLVTEYVPGPTLADRLREGPLPPDAVRKLALDLAGALEAAHARGVVHRDLKPSNVLLGPYGTKVIDFGIARFVDGEDLTETEQLTKTGHVLGTLPYLAPEQFKRGGPPAGPPADVWAWALTVGCAARGRGCFVMQDGTEHPYPGPEETPDLNGVPDDLLPLLSAALDRDPAMRPTSRDLVNALRPLVEPPRRKAPRVRRARKWQAVSAGAAVAVLIPALIVIPGYWKKDPPPPDLGVCVSALTRKGSECVGVADPIIRADAFGPELRTIVGKIAQENQRVAEEAASDKRKPFVRVALVMPYSANDSSPLSWTAIRESLAGAYAAQCRANACPGLKGRSTTGLPGKVPGVQLLLANEGSAQQHWRTVTDQLATMKSGDHPVVGAVGLGVSLPETQRLADRLSELKIPAVGGPLTATSLESPYLFKASASNLQHISAVRKAIGPLQEGRRGFLVYDINDDLYVKTLREAFDQEFKDTIGTRRTGYAGSTGQHVVPKLFGQSVQDICYSGSDLVFYAGRDNDFPDFVKALANRGLCSQEGGLRPITVVTCWSGRSAFSGNPERVKELTRDKITVIDVSVLNPESWKKGGSNPRGFTSFRTSFTELGHTDAELDDGYAIMNHDAVLTVAWAAESFANQTGGAVPGPQDVYNQIINLHGANWVAAASGNLEFFDPQYPPHGWAKGAQLTISEFG
ncbi:bifunctional serine/threonine-protein kinase/ABC transporter substrate-binding protein [Streptomyces tropicalis]|uniref:Bifunctional serine/threonine-protein kinase/ABC transporter substrate-binding protein n=1 Tax=Streptomyces tropicalis TaxID=3034234 RepID=A0ABT6A488_9ACTN|nr:bifunctional serine/threonine-protein kinase/ABC transporter substrate-binding protein [Streptomyces tropicalis]MDF3299461.1 bifunctional serine/threonine-protein kinase/ABC transporter substrate-binding protein [Streptomyces tropicalis]